MEEEQFLFLLTLKIHSLIPLSEDLLRSYFIPLCYGLRLQKFMTCLYVLIGSVAPGVDIIGF